MPEIASLGPSGTFTFSTCPYKHEATPGKEEPDFLPEAPSIACIIISTIEHRTIQYFRLVMQDSDIEQRTFINATEHWAACSYCSFDRAE
jgi:hypothetical protein